MRAGWVGLMPGVAGAPRAGWNVAAGQRESANPNDVAAEGGLGKAHPAQRTEQRFDGVIAVDSKVDPFARALLRFAGQFLVSAIGEGTGVLTC